MLVAIAIISAVGIAVSTATGGVAGQVYSLERRTVAHWVAENHLTKIRLEQSASLGQPIKKGKKNTRVFMGKRRWFIETNILELDNPWLRLVEIDVFEMVDGDRVGPISHTVSLVGQY